MSTMPARPIPRELAREEGGQQRVAVLMVEVVEDIDHKDGIPSLEGSISLRPG
jgi:hypothetical protein